ncbi:MAG: ribose 5-phosphate isomerase B [Acidobacteriota bacterium]|nr:ribose 5-phosphate isomerase B [Acidobacteriota bacterium]
MPEKLKVAVGSDHAGFALKESVREYLQEKGFAVEDCGVHSESPADYPDYAERVARRVAGEQAGWGVVVCGTGLGVSIAANKVPGIRAAMCTDTLLARFARAHNNANVLAMGGRIVDESQARNILDTWLSTPFEGGRHQQRVEKITAIEQRQTEEKES